MTEIAAKTLWGKKWTATIDSIYSDAEAFHKKENPFLKENVIKIAQTGNKIIALAQAYNASPHHIELEINSYSPTNIAFIENLFQTIQKEVKEIDENVFFERIFYTFKQKAIPLYPEKGELITSCSCSDSQAICSHRISVLYLLTSYFDSNPLFLFEWRGFYAEKEKPRIRVNRRNSRVDKSLLDNMQSKRNPLPIPQEGIIPVIHISILQNQTFSLKLFVEDKSDSLSAPIPYSELYETELQTILGRSPNSIKIDLLKKLMQIGIQVPELVQLLHKKGKEEVVVSLDRISEILMNQREVLESMGIGFILPFELREIIKPVLSYFSNTPKTIQYLDASDVMKFDLKIALGDMEISPKEFAELSKNAGKLVPFRDRFVFMSAADVTKVVSSLNMPAEKMSNSKILYYGIVGKYRGEDLKLDKNFNTFLEKLYEPADTTLPKGINAVMRQYQEQGFAWMYSTLKKGLGVCIADDMGLGKTLQVIAVILKLKQEKKLKKQVLIVCPTTILGNWLREIERFAPELKAKIYHGDDKTFSKSADIVITTYTLVRLHSDIFSNREWTILVVDEAQNIKNPDSQQSRSVKAIQAEYKIAMSGTPVENRLTELWSIFDFLNPDYLGNLKWFKKEYAIPIEAYHHEIKIQQFKKLTAPFMIRRLKSDKSIIADLPDKIIGEEYCYLSKEQIAIYQNVVNEGLDVIMKLEGIQRRGKVFQMITALKQICNHPAHFTKKKTFNPNHSGKTQRILSLLENILPTGEKTILFTQYTEMGDILLAILEKHLSIKADFFHGSLGRKAREKMISNFQNDDTKKLLLISLKAGGTGLNLVQATNIIHFDLWWNPAVEDQATDRAYRIGQTKNVQVHRLITIGTFEEKIDEIIRGKRKLADMTIANGEKWITELSNKELKDLFSLSGMK